VEGQARQLVRQELRIPLGVIDLRGLGAEEREQERKRLAVEEGQRPFDLTRGPLLRLSLLRLGESEHEMLLTMHHIVSDGWSLGVFLRELGVLYEAYAMGQESPLAELPVQYADFAQWQREQWSGAVLEQQLGYWRGQLRGAPAGLELPSDYGRPAVQSFRGGLHYFTLPVELVRGLRKLSQSEGATLFMTLLAGFKALLYRYTGQRDVVIGSPIANRTRSELEGLIGFFSNTLVLRTKVSGDWSFRELVGKVREVTLGAYAHQDLPFEKLVEELQPERNLNRNPLFQVFFVFQAGAGGKRRGEAAEESEVKEEERSGESGAENAPPSSVTQTAKFDLTLYVVEQEGGGLGCAWEYSTDLFRAETMERMGGHLQVLLRGGASEPEQRLSELPLLRDRERRQLLLEWNATAGEYRADSSLPGLFEEQAERRPEAVAVEDGEERVSYRELNERANQLGRYLRRLGVGAEVRVGICVERGIEMVVAVLGVLKAGGAYVPLDPAYPRERLEVMLRDAEAALVLSQDRVAGRLPANAGRIVLMDVEWDEIARESNDNLECSVDGDSLAYVIYTSGSTGNPKGVMIEHRGLCNVAEAQRRAFRLQPSDRILQFASLGFDASVAEILMALAVGGTLYLATADCLLPGSDLIFLLRGRNITVVTLSPSALAALPVEPLPALRIVNVAGEECSGELPARWANGREFFNLYGPTEATIWATSSACAENDSRPSIGRPILNTQVYILDPRLQPVPVGVPGELHLGGKHLARGYLGRPEMTAERFIPNSFSEEPGARLYKTGDLARYRADGNIEFLGRLDHQVKIRGFRVETGEIEGALEQHASVRQAVVVAQADGSGHKRLVAYLVAKQQGQVSTTELRSWLQAKLPEYMMPSVFMQLEKFPLSPNGKVDRRVLSVPEGMRPEVEADFVGPRNRSEEMIAGIWSEVLGVEQVGIHDNFFELGGHSLLATQVISRVREVFQVEVPLRRLFESPTIADLIVAIVQTQIEQMATEGEQILAEIEQLSEHQTQVILSDSRAANEFKSGFLNRV